MKKIVITLLLWTIHSISYASIPNYWEEEIGKGGFVYYTISNSNGNEISFHCNEASVTQIEHGISLYPKGSMYPELEAINNQESVIDFLIDNKVYNFPQSSSSYRESVKWDNFIKVLTKATQFDVYWNGIFFGSFSPKNLEIIDNFARCKSIWERDRAEGNLLL